MSAAGLYRALALDGYVVLDTWQSEVDGRVRVLVEASRERLRCRSCGGLRVHVHEHAVRTWLSAPIGLTPVEVVMDSPRVKCLGGAGEDVASADFCKWSAADCEDL